MTSNTVEEIDRKIQSYLARQIFKIQGFCQTIDARLLHSIILCQANEGISGALVEVGVWHGKSFCILAKGRLNGEKSLAVDLFPTRPLVKGERQQIDEFRDNCASAQIALAPDEILCGDSLQMTTSDVLSRVGPVRLAHVDGAHDYKHALHDIRVASSTLIEQGVLVIDDAFNSQWPEVSAAICDWLRDGSDFIPWAVTPQKLYLARGGSKLFYESMARKHFSRELGRYTELFGSEFIILGPTMVEKLRERLMTTLFTPRQVKIPRA